MGKFSRDEKIVSCVFIAALALWATAQFTKLDATIVALMGVGTMLVTGVLTWNDVTEDKGRLGYDGLDGDINWPGRITEHPRIYSMVRQIDRRHDQWSFLDMGVGDSAYPVYVFPLFLCQFERSYHRPVSGFCSGCSGSWRSALFGGALPVIHVESLCIAYPIIQQGQRRYTLVRALSVKENGGRMGFIVATVNLVIWLGIGGLWWKIIGLW